MGEVGHNQVAREQLRSLVERIERLEDEKKAISDDIRDVYAEAKGNGFDTKVLRQVISLRKMDQTERQEQDAIRDLYLSALGMLPEPEFDFSGVSSEIDEAKETDPESETEPDDWNGGEAVDTAGIAGDGMPDLPASLDRRNEASA